MDEFCFAFLILTETDSIVEMWLLPKGLQIQYNPFQNLKGFFVFVFFSEKQIHPKIHMVSQRTSNSQNNLEIKLELSYFLI